VPNVTAIDWKQADALGPGLEHKGGMSFTVQRLVPPFPSCIYLRASRWRGHNFTARFLALAMAVEAPQPEVFQVKCPKENKNASKEIY